MKNYWYKDKIESGVRDLVRYLRNRGVNTECSCEHKNYIQCQYIPDGFIQDLHNLLFTYFVEKKASINYTINIIHQVIDGKSYSSLDIQLGENDGKTI